MPAVRIDIAGGLLQFYHHCAACHDGLSLVQATLYLRPDAVADSCLHLSLHVSVGFYLHEDEVIAHFFKQRCALYAQSLLCGAGGDIHIDERSRDKVADVVHLKRDGNERR